MRGFLCLALAACGGGAYVEVHTGDLDVTQVELVTGIGDCHTLDGERCEQIIGDAAVGFVGPMGSPGDLYKRGPTGTAPVVDGVASFELDPGLPLPVAFAIGRDLQGQVIGAAVVDHTIDDTSGPIIYRVDLDPAEDLFTKQPDPSKAGVTQWGAVDRCIGVAPIRPHARKPIFILPRDNPDCDAIAGDPGECNPLWFDGMQFDEGSAAHCVVRSTRLGTADRAPCVLGHQPECVEGVQPGNGVMPCIESNSCLPDAVCATNDGCDDFNEVCQQTILLSTPGPRIACAAPGEPAATDSKPCPTPVPNTLDLAAMLFDPITNVQFIQPPQTGPFTPYHGSRTDQLQVGGLQFKIMRAGNTVSIQRSGLGPTTITIETVLVVTTQKPNAEDHEIWIPITLGLSTGGCGNAIPCSFDGVADTVFTCGG